MNYMEKQEALTELEDKKEEEEYRFKMSDLKLGFQPRGSQGFDMVISIEIESTNTNLRLAKYSLTLMRIPQHFLTAFLSWYSDESSFIRFDKPSRPNYSLGLKVLSTDPE